MNDNDAIGPWLVGGLLVGVFLALAWLAVAGPDTPRGDQSFDPSTAVRFGGEK